MATVVTHTTDNESTGLPALHSPAAARANDTTLTDVFSSFSLNSPKSLLNSPAVGTSQASPKFKGSSPLFREYRELLQAQEERSIRMKVREERMRARWKAEEDQLAASAHIAATTTSKDFSVGTVPVSPSLPLAPPARLPKLSTENDDDVNLPPLQKPFCTAPLPSPSSRLGKGLADNNNRNPTQNGGKEIPSPANKFAKPAPPASPTTPTTLIIRHPVPPQQGAPSPVAARKAFTVTNCATSSGTVVVPATVEPPPRSICSSVSGSPPGSLRSIKVERKVSFSGEAKPLVGLRMLMIAAEQSLATTSMSPVSAVDVYPAGAVPSPPPARRKPDLTIGPRRSSLRQTPGGMFPSAGSSSPVGGIFPGGTSTESLLTPIPSTITPKHADFPLNFISVQPGGRVSPNNVSPKNSSRRTSAASNPFGSDAPFAYRWESKHSWAYSPSTPPLDDFAGYYPFDFPVLSTLCDVAFEKHEEQCPLLASLSSLHSSTMMLMGASASASGSGSAIGSPPLSLQSSQNLAVPAISLNSGNEGTS